MTDPESKRASGGTGEDGDPAPMRGEEEDGRWRGRIAPGLYFVATPIGSARDITLRAMDLLAGADVIAAEDTRTARKLMEIHGIPLRGRTMIAYHDHNGASVRPRLLDLLAEGRSVVYVSEAGTPLVADPGFQLGRAAIAAGADVTAAPGASAVLAALTVSGLPSDRFLFAGFPPAQVGARLTWIKALDAAAATVIIYDSPKRVHRLLGEFCDVMGADRPAAICRELTKRFEEVLRGSLGELSEMIAGRVLKGEVVLVIGRTDRQAASAEDVESALLRALEEMPVKAAATEIAEAFDLPRRDVYQMALKMKDK